MAAPRIGFLWPRICKSVHPIEASLCKVASPYSLRPPPKAGFRTLAARRTPDAQPTSRYGSANEPPPQFSGETPLNPPVVKVFPKPDVEKVPQSERKASQDTASDRKDKTPSTTPTVADSSPKAATSTKSTQIRETEQTSPGQGPTALSTILRMPETFQESQQPPHLKAPPYVHHFDTHTLVRCLQDSGWSEDQAVTLMKAVRSSLADNMSLAQEGLVSKADAEMESYLFQAASAELKSEIQNNRDQAKDQMRTERTQLQHEFDILNQKLSGEASNLRDDLKGMFDDRKMAARMERRKMENEIQELNYKITVALNSDTRSEIEGLRWVLTRRTAFALGTVVFMVLATLRYASYMERKQEVDRQRMEKIALDSRGSFDYDGPIPASGTSQIEAMKRTDPSALISLG